MDASNKAVQYVPGDLLWAKVGSHPPWPSMVGYDPTNGIYFRLCKSKNGAHEYIIYHVQFFGDQTLRAWTTRNIIPFEGAAKFYEKHACHKSKENHLGRNGLKLLNNGHQISIKLAKSWENAVEEAEVALKITDITERYSTYVFSYDNVKKKKSKNILQNPQTLSSQNIVEASKAEAYKTKKLKQATVSEGEKRICTHCIKPDANISCVTCHKDFHLDCLGLISAITFECAECKSGVHSCFSCEKLDETVIKCRHPNCYKFYHPDCLEKLPGRSEKNECPYHTCHTCFKEDPRNSMAHKGLLVKCFTCPSAFHARKSCMPAGCVELVSNAFVLCPFHFILKKKKSKRLQVINLNNCDKCGEGGNLVCCDACPHAYHQKCLENDNVPGEIFLCESCLKKNHIYYSMIVFCKLGAHSWWPAQVLNPSDDLPHNIKKLPHEDSEFPVKFFGTYNYNWSHRGRVLSYEEHYQEFNNTVSGKKKNDYKRGLLEAEEELELFKAYRQSLSPLCNIPPSYKSIKVNRPSKDCPVVTVKEKDVVQCNCIISDPSPCGTNDCMNRSTFIECIPKNCLADDKCQNQRFQKRQYKKSKIIKTDLRGWGLAALENIRKGEFVIEYVGEIISLTEYHKRSAELQEQKNSDFYFLYLDSRRMIDARPMGNYARFINHSCDPNCVMEKWLVCGDFRVGIFALKDIIPGEELSFDYQAEKYDILQDCFCNSSNCRGIIGKSQNQ